MCAAQILGALEMLNESDLDQPLGNVTAFDDEIRTIGAAAATVCGGGGCVSAASLAVMSVAGKSVEEVSPECKQEGGCDSCCDFGDTSSPVAVFPDMPACSSAVMATV